MREDWSGIEVGLSRFIDLCKMLKRTEADAVLFLRDGTAYVEGPSGRGKDANGDYAFLFEIAKTNHAVSIPSRELLATYRLLGLQRDTRKTVRGQSIRLSPNAITILPRETVYRRRLLVFPISESVETRLQTLSSFSPDPNLTLLPKKDSSYVARVGALKVHLTLGPAVIYHARGVSRIAGFSTAQAVLVIESRPARSLLALCERDASDAESFMSGCFTGDILYLKTRHVFARIQPSIEKRKPT